MKVVKNESLSSDNDQVRIYPPSKQGSGSLDGGKITEIKPIGFGQDGSAVTRIRESDGVRVKSIIGGESPIKLVADARMEHWLLAANASFGLGDNQDRTQAIVAVEGDFTIQDGTDPRHVQARDFLVVTGKLDNALLTAGEHGGELMVVDVPTKVSYPLLKK